MLTSCDADGSETMASGGPSGPTFVTRDPASSVRDQNFFGVVP